MIAYFDTSALVPMLVAEPASGVADDDFVVVSGDRRLLDACYRLSLSVADVNQVGDGSGVGYRGRETSWRGRR